MCVQRAERFESAMAEVTLVRSSVESSLASRVMRYSSGSLNTSRVVETACYRNSGNDP